MYIVYFECPKSDKLCESFRCEDYWKCRDIRTKVLAEMPEFGVKEEVDENAGSKETGKRTSK